MDFTKIKKIEDLKSKSNELGKVISDKRRQLKKSFIDKTKRDFKAYFEDKGFSVSSDTYSSSAKYGDYLVNLKCSSETEDFFGCLAVYELLINSKNRKIIINRIGSETNITTSVRSIPKNEDARLDMEIKELEKSIASMESRIADSSEVKLGYMVSDENKYSNVREEKYIESIGELIDSLN